MFKSALPLVDRKPWFRETVRAKLSASTPAQRRRQSESMIAVAGQSREAALKAGYALYFDALKSGPGDKRLRKMLPSVLKAIKTHYDSSGAEDARLVCSLLGFMPTQGWEVEWRTSLAVLRRYLNGPDVVMLGWKAWASRSETDPDRFRTIARLLRSRRDVYRGEVLDWYGKGPYAVSTLRYWEANSWSTAAFQSRSLADYRTAISLLQEAADDPVLWKDARRQSAASRDELRRVFARIE